MTAPTPSGGDAVRNAEGFTVSVWREQIGSDRTELNIHYPDGRFGFMIRLTDEERRRLAEVLHPALLAALRETLRYFVECHSIQGTADSERYDRAIALLNRAALAATPEGP